MQLDGQLERVGARSRLTFTRSLRHAPEKVWRALTETEQLAKWFPDGRGTLLTLTDTFDEYGKAARDGAGWHACLDMLGFALDEAVPAGDHGSYWREVHPGYVERFGPEASTIGPPAGHE